MTTQRLGLIMNGVTGRMGLNQHLIRSIIAIRDQGGVLLSNGEEFAYDRLLLCIGALPRRMTCPGSDLAGVNYLRNVDDAAAISAGLKPGARVIIVGGGYIGLEIAATAREMGCAVSVLEMADRVMSRVVASSVSEYFEHEHRAQGVKIICNTRVVRF